MKTVTLLSGIFIILFSTSACSPIIAKLYGFKQPSAKSDEEVLKSADAMFGDQLKSDLFRPKSDTALAKLFNDYEIGLPGIIFFNSDGQRVSMHDDTLKSCTANAEAFIQQLSNLDKLPKLDLTKADIDILLNPIGSSDLTTSSTTSQATYNIVVFWSIFAGKRLNREKTENWLATYNSLDEDTKSRVGIEVVNMDFLPGM